MAILKTRCPECNAALKSSTGFTVGQNVCCPKCETYFAVEDPEDEKDEDDEPKKATTKGKGKDAPAGKKPVKAAASDDDEEEEEDEKPKSKKKKKAAYDEDEEPTRSYKNSPVRFVILGVLIIIMCVLGYFLWVKKQKEKESAEGGGSTGGAGGEANGPIPPPPGGVNPVRPPLPGELPGGLPGGPKGKLPNPGKQPNPGNAGAGGIPFGLGGGPVLTPADIQKRTDKFKTALVGTWKADLGGDATEELTYNANGTYTVKLTGPAATTSSGKYTVLGPVGSSADKGLKLQIDTGGNTRTITVIFEDDELLHPSLQPGVTGTFRKK